MAEMKHQDPLAGQLQRALMHCDAARREAYKLKKERDELRIEIVALRDLAATAQAERDMMKAELASHSIPGPPSDCTGPCRIEYENLMVVDGAATSVEALLDA